jgi:DNA polymerase-3 subunit beta
MEIGFNPQFLVDALKVAGATSVTMEMKDSMRPGVIKVGQEFVYVIMPVSLG